MNSILVGLLGILLNSIGLCFFGDAIIHYAMANGAIAAGALHGILGLVLINLGIWLLAEAVGLRRAARVRE
jgi:ABC-type Mn2+/Zn2+ transport system permease subunit